MDILDRFFSKVDKTDTCWIWKASTTKQGGYGQFSYNGKPVRAHRWLWIQTNGEIPNGLVLDHLCRNRKCVNPDHLEIVTLGENVKRGLAGIENNYQTKKECCPKGHTYSGTDNRGKRICKICRSANQQKYIKAKMS